MYVRFVVAEIDDHSQRAFGGFHAAYRLRDDGKLHPHEEVQLDTVRQWFNANLEEPARWTASKPPHYRTQRKAISWFKDSAHDHITGVREMVAILQNHGVAVQMVKAERVGYVV